MGILIVDDSQDNCLVIKSMLKAAGYPQVEMVYSAAEAFQRLGIDGAGQKIGMMEAKEIDLILMDIMMPEMDGIEALRIIKSNPELRDIPVIMVTALTDMDNLQKAFAAGASDYITKPVRMVELLARVGAALRLKREMEARKQQEQDLREEASKLEETVRRLETLSHVDALTGVANRRLFDKYLQKEWRRAKRNGTSLALIMADIDFFKKYNDALGHQEGDHCLQEVAQTLANGVSRSGDMLCRYGGEEFAVILPETDLDGAVRIAHKLQKLIEEQQIPHPSSSVSPYVTLSYGVAALCPENGKEPGELVEMADRGLYRAKAEGRNQVRAAVEE